MVSRCLNFESRILTRKPQQTDLIGGLDPMPLFLLDDLLMYKQKSKTKMYSLLLLLSLLTNNFVILKLEYDHLLFLH